MTPAVDNPQLLLIFDVDYYLRMNADVAAANVDPALHFTQTGVFERRHCHPRLERLLGAGFSSGILRCTSDLVKLFRPDDLQLITLDSWWQRLKGFFQADYYRTQATSAGLHGSSDLDDLHHFLLIGLHNNLRPSILFDPPYYRSVTKQYNATDAHLFLEWLDTGFEARIVPTPLFDEQYYRSTYSDMARFKGWTFSHYYLYGLKEPRRPTSFFDPQFFRKQTPEVKHPAHLLDYALNYPQVATAAGVNLRQPDPSSPCDITPLEAYAREASLHLRSLQEEELREVVRRAALIEPSIWQPLGTRQVIIPPLRHDQNMVAAAAAQLLDRLGNSVYDLVVLIPHCRVGGAARVAGAFEGAIRSAHPTARVVVVTTESPEFQRPEWFQGAHVVDASEPMAELDRGRRALALAHVLRSLRCKTVITINSRLGWETFSIYGSQLHQEMRLTAYLFTYDINSAGHKVGYPIGPLQSAMDYIDLVILDNAALRDEIITRYQLPPLVAERFKVLYTPATPVEVDFSSSPAPSSERPRAIWAGRFDRQKRFDLVVEIARAWPELEVLAWGKSVIGDYSFDEKELPANISLMGEYEHFDDLPLGEAHFLLYTSAWDGLPTILIDAGLRGLTVVASKVGGVGEILDDDTGWPVELATDPFALKSAMEEAFMNPGEAKRRGAALRERARRMTGLGAFTRSLALLYPELSQND